MIGAGGQGHWANVPNQTISVLMTHTGHGCSIPNPERDTINPAAMPAFGLTVPRPGNSEGFQGPGRMPPLCPPPGGQLSWSAHRAQGFSAATHRLGWVAPTTKPRPKPLLLKGTLMAQRRPCITQSASRYLMSGPKTLGDYWVHLSLVQMGKLKPNDQI